MVRRAVLSDRTADSYAESTVVERPPIASVIARAISAVYTAVVSVIGLDALLRAMDARQGNDFVHAIRVVADPLVAPFRGIFANQQWWATALIAAVVYTVVYLILMAVLGRNRD